MAATNQHIGESDEPYYEGDSLEVTVPVEEDGSAKPLTGATVEWAMSPRPGAEEELSEADTGVTVSVSDAAAGEITLTIDAGVTDGLEGSWYHEFRVEDQDGDKAVVTRGQVTIAERVTK